MQHHAFPCSINRPKMSILVVPHMPCPDRILPLRQHQHFIQRECAIVFLAEVLQSINARPSPKSPLLIVRKT